MKDLVIGYNFKVTHEFTDGHRYLSGESTYGWENGDQLEIIHIRDTEEG